MKQFEPNEKTFLLKRSTGKNVKTDQEAVKRRHAIEAHQANIRNKDEFEEMWNKL